MFTNIPIKITAQAVDFLDNVTLFIDYIILNPRNFGSIYAKIFVKVMKNRICRPDGFANAYIKLKISEIKKNFIPT